MLVVITVRNAAEAVLLVVALVQLWRAGAVRPQAAGARMTA